MVNIIAAEKTYSLRLKVLRPNQAIESVKFDADHQLGTFHLGYILKEEVVSVASFMVSEYEGAKAFQLRGMATHPDYLKRGYAKSLLIAAEKIIKALEISLIWLNARKVALPFYKKLGYEIISEPFMIEEIGIHYKMKKEL